MIRSWSWLLAAILAGAFCLCPAPAVDAEEEVASVKESDEGTIEREEDIEVEIGGLLINDMVTPVGNDFFDYFSTHWTPPAGSEGFNIVFKERPDPRWGSLIWVLVNDDIVYTRLLPSRRANIDEAVTPAIQAVLRSILTAELQTLPAGGDLADSGF